MTTFVAVGVLMFIAVIHSILGEREILTPLFAAEWETPTPRFAMEKILRFAWHLTSIAWVALGAAALGVGVLDAFAACALLSAGIIFFTLRGHLAWPLFLLSGGAALLAAGHLPPKVVSVVMHCAALVCFVTASVHVYWAAGGSWGVEDALPQRREETGESKAIAHPTALATMLVASALAFLGALLVWTAWTPVAKWQTWMLGAGAIVLGLRSMGDGKYVGLTKTIRDTRFARLDDELYTPLIVLLTFGCIGALVI